MIFNLAFANLSASAVSNPSSVNDDGVAHDCLIIVCFGVDVTSCPEAKSRAPRRPAHSGPVSKATVSEQEQELAAHSSCCLSAPLTPSVKIIQL